MPEVVDSFNFSLSVSRFEGLVNYKYWSYLWLNYGPATHVTHQTVNEEFAEYMEEDLRWFYEQVTLLRDSAKNVPMLDLKNPNAVPQDDEILLFNQPLSFE